MQVWLADEDQDTYSNILADASKTRLAKTKPAPNDITDGR